QEGRFWMQRPNKLRWVYERPYKQVLVNDGTQFWLFDEDLAQVTVRPSKEALQNAPMMLLSGGPELTDKFTLEALPAANDMSWVGIEPRDKEGDFVAARMGLRNGLPAILELSDSLDQQTRILFINMRVNNSIAATQFEFVIPADVEVIGEPAAGGY
ncbi:MAG: outer-membrane lipoprotein carrier protein LolA, partial [Nevskiales bacterium]